jgi:hypothetical protein
MRVNHAELKAWIASSGADFEFVQLVDDLADGEMIALGNCHFPNIARHADVLKALGLTVHREEHPDVPENHAVLYWMPSNERAAARELHGKLLAGEIAQLMEGGNHA